MRRAVITAAFLIAPATVIAQVQRGTIAVIPFGAANAQMQETASALAVAVENALQESGRFMAVLPRSGDAAIKGEIGKTTEPTSLQSLVQIAQDAQLNANFVLAGWVVGQETKAVTNGHAASARVAVRILDVSTGAMVLSEVVTVYSGQQNAICGGGIGGAACQAQNALKRNWAHKTPQEALQSVRTNGNAKVEVQNVLNEKFGFVALDLLEEGGKTMLVLRVGGGEPKRGAKLQAVQTRTSSLSGASYNTPIGKLEVTAVSGETATANITEGAPAIIKALKEKQAVLFLKQ